MSTCSAPTARRCCHRWQDTGTLCPHLFWQLAVCAGRDLFVDGGEDSSELGAMCAARSSFVLESEQLEDSRAALCTVVPCFGWCLPTTVQLLSRAAKTAPPGFGTCRSLYRRVKYKECQCVLFFEDADEFGRRRREQPFSVLLGL